MWVPLVAVLAMLGSGAWLVTQQQDGLAGRFGAWDGAGGSMMGGNPRAGWLAGDGASVDDLTEARDRAEAYAATLAPGLRAGEVMGFSNNYYAELAEADGSLATEVLIDRRTGAVRMEIGPAMMWNTRYGMMAGPDEPARVDPEEARRIAQQWAGSRDGVSVAQPEAFPGYYTLHTLRDERIDGMLSVNSQTGAVWYHGWHGEFQDMSEGS
jgi:hypothetical protein